MEKQPRIQPSQAYSVNDNLARQPYPQSCSTDEQEAQPLEEDANILPLKQRSLESVAEAELTPRSTAKRKQSGASQGKGRTASKQKSMKTFRQQQNANLQPYAEELKRLEEQAERINQILTERSQKRAWMEQSQSLRGASFPGQYAPRQYAQASSQPSPAPSLEEEDTENLKLHAQRIHQRLAEMEAAIEAAAAAPPPTPSAFYGDRPQTPPSFQPPQSSPSPSSYPQSYPLPAQAQASQSRAQPQASQPQTPQPQTPWTSQPHSRDAIPDWQQQADYAAWLAAEELRHLSQRSQPFIQNPDPRSPDGYTPGSRNYPADPQDGSHYRHRPPAHEPRGQHSGHYSGFSLQRFLKLRFSEISSQPLDRIGNAAVWIAGAAIARVACRYLLASVPFLSPVFSLLLLTPAILAVFLAFFVPRAGWVLYYRLFLITLGLLLGGKL